MTDRVIDLRSDTVTRPTPEMRRAMAEAVVGDDVYGEDPTVNALQERCAQMFGKEAALYVTSGTMANQACIRAHTQPGDEVIAEARSHIYNCECGGIAANSGAQVRPVFGRNGIFSAADVEALIRPGDLHFPRTRVVCIENTHNMAGGTIFPLESIVEISRMARARGLCMHLDGARIANACVATGISPSEYARHFDSVTLCFSKGLGAPVGSIIAGSRELVDRARRARKTFGGGMRQAGIIAAGALHALEHHVPRLAEDHDNARLIADALRGVPGVRLNPETVETNIVFFEVETDAKALAARLKERGVLVGALGPGRLRAVTHLDVSCGDAQRAAGILRDTLMALRNVG